MIMLLFEFRRVSIATCCSFEGGRSTLGLSRIPVGNPGRSGISGRVDAAECEDLRRPCVRNRAFTGQDPLGILSFSRVENISWEALGGMGGSADVLAETRSAQRARLMARRDMANMEAGRIPGTRTQVKEECRLMNLFPWPKRICNSARRLRSKVAGRLAGGTKASGPSATDPADPPLPPVTGHVVTGIGSVRDSDIESEFMVGAIGCHAIVSTQLTVICSSDSTLGLLNELIWEPSYGSARLQRGFSLACWLDLHGPFGHEQRFRG